MFTPAVLAALIATVAAAREKGTFAILQHNSHAGSPLMTCRIDPIVSPGQTSAHVHAFMGGNGVAKITTGESLQKSTCTTAKVKADKSAYWMPSLYFKDPDTGLLEPVEFNYMNVYYFFDATNDDLKSFPLGLNLVAGKPKIRSAPEGAQAGTTNLDPEKGPLTPAHITCPRKSYEPGSYPEGSDGSMAGIQNPHNKGEGFGFPFQNCDTDYSPMRMDVTFPSCYNPDAGLTAYESNSAYPTDAGDGKVDCPEGWIHMPRMFYETYWSTTKFADRWAKLRGKENPFVFSNGDATGFSVHADFISGWDEKALQQIIDSECNAAHSGLHTCPGLIGGVSQDECKAECPVDEDVIGPLEKLPGNNPIAGWQYGGGDLPSSPATSPKPTPEEDDSSNSPVAGPAPVENAPTQEVNPPAPSTASPAASSKPVVVPAPVKIASSSPAPSPAPTPSNAPVAAQPVAEDQESPAPAPTPTRQAGWFQGNNNKKLHTVWETETVWHTQTVYQTVYKREPEAVPTAAAAHYLSHRRVPNFRRHGHGHSHERR